MSCPLKADPNVAGHNENTKVGRGKERGQGTAEIRETFTWRIRQRLLALDNRSYLNKEHKFSVLGFY